MHQAALMLLIGQQQVSEWRSQLCKNQIATGDRKGRQAVIEKSREIRNDHVCLRQAFFPT